MSRGPGCPLADLGTVFIGIRPQSLARLQEAAELREVPPAVHLLKQGERPTHFHVVREGCLKLAHLTATGAQIGLGFAGPGDPVGWPSVLRPMPHAISALAVTETVVIRWTSAQFDAVAADDPALLRNALRFICDRTDALMAQLREFVTEPVEQRLARALQRIAQRERSELAPLTPPVSRQDLAELTGTTHFTVSRILKDWEEEGLIANRRPRILVCDAQRLRDRAEGPRGAIRRRRPPRSPAVRAAERHPER